MVTTGEHHLETNRFSSPADVRSRLQRNHYFADSDLASTVYLAQQLSRPVFVEGVPGGGKTYLAQALAQTTGRELIRLQCYSGMDASAALFDWDFAAQILHLRGVQQRAVKDEHISVYSEEFLEARPLLQSLYNPNSVLLIDEVDRSDEEFEAVLLEYLSEFAITVPHFGTIRAAEAPLVILTSNRMRDVHPALKRRCLYHYVGHPTPEREAAILLDNFPATGMYFAEELVRYINEVRNLTLVHPPGLAEVIDFAGAIHALGNGHSTSAVIEGALSALIKHPDDRAQARTVRYPNLQLTKNAE